MPIYQYYCAQCDAEFELIRPPAKADDPAPCKTCEKPGQRQLTNFSFKSDTFTSPKLKALPQEPLRGRNRESPSQNPPG